MEVFVQTDMLPVFILLIQYACTIFYLIFSILYCFSIFYSFVIMHRKPQKDPEKGFPPITIIKPLMGVDSTFLENVESHFLLNYPIFEILLCIKEKNDPAVEECKKIMAKFPSVDATILITDNPNKKIVNPMVANMVPAYEHAKYDIIWVSAAKIKAADHIAFDLAEKASRPTVGLAHQMPFCLSQSSFASAVDKVYFGAFYSRVCLTSNILGVNFVTGMSYMFEKSKLEVVGGMEHFGRFLNEDMFISNAFHNSGYQNLLSSFPAQQNYTNLTLKAITTRHVRWTRLRLNTIPFVALFLEPLITCPISGLLLIISCSLVFPEADSLPMFLFHVLSCFLLDYLLIIGVEHGNPRLGIISYLFAWLVKEVQLVLHLLLGLLCPHTIKWGPRVYYIHCGGITDVISE